MIKVVHLITDLDLGGAESMLARLVRGLNSDRFQNHVISLVNPGPPGETIQSAGIVVSSLQMKRGIPDPLALFRLYRHFKAIRPDILQTWLYHADFLGLLVGKLAGVPIILWNIRCSEMDMTQYSPWSRVVRWILGKMASVPNAIVVNSQAGRQSHEALGYRPKFWQVITNGFDLDQFYPNPEARTQLRKQWGLPMDAVVIGLICRYDPMKDHLNFLHAAHYLLQTFPETHFVMAGKGVDPQNLNLVQVMRNLEVTGNLHLLGERRDVPVLLAGLDILTSSSAFGEGFPNIVGEAMACGVPCVVTDVGDSACMVSTTGKVVKPKDSKALASAWEELILLGQEGRQKLGWAARQRIQDHFDLKKVVAQYETFYLDLVNQKELTH